MNAYIITNKTNGKKYIGIAKSAKKRWADHRSAARRGSRLPLHQAIARYGEEAFSFEVVATAADWKELCSLERALIAQHNSLCHGGHGYNLTLGGEGVLGLVRTAEFAEMVRARNKGYRHTAEARALISAALSQRICKPETRSKYSTIHKGKIVSEETRRKQSISAKRRAPTNAGREFSTEWRANLAQASRGRMMGRRCITDGNTNRFIISGAPIPVGWRLGKTSRAIP